MSTAVRMVPGGPDSHYTVGVRVCDADGSVLEGLRALPVWIQAIAELLQRCEGGEAVRLELPGGVHDTWTIIANGIPFRCCVMWVMFPIDGEAPGWRGRVDVRVRRMP